jgi:uncharacterized protein (UPF0303 family)
VARETPEELLAQEEELQFTSFSNDDAWALGNALVAAARERGLAVTVSVCRGEQRLFHCALEGTAADNDHWIERKNRVVRRFGHSSYYIGVGVVGTVSASGLPQEEDHRLVVSVLRDFLG